MLTLRCKTTILLKQFWRDSPAKTFESKIVMVLVKASCTRVISYDSLKRVICMLASKEGLRNYILQLYMRGSEKKRRVKRTYCGNVVDR